MPPGSVHRVRRPAPPSSGLKRTRVAPDRTSMPEPLSQGWIGQPPRYVPEGYHARITLPACQLEVIGGSRGHHSRSARAPPGRTDRSGARPRGGSRDGFEPRALRPPCPEEVQRCSRSPAGALMQFAVSGLKPGQAGDPSVPASGNPGSSGACPPRAATGRGVALHGGIEDRMSSPGGTDADFPIRRPILRPAGEFACAARGQPANDIRNPGPRRNLETHPVPFPG